MLAYDFENTASLQNGLIADATSMDADVHA
jgi:hypothetical protein